MADFGAGSGILISLTLFLHQDFGGCVDSVYVLKRQRLLMMWITALYENRLCLGGSFTDSLKRARAQPSQERRRSRAESRLSQHDVLFPFLSAKSTPTWLKDVVSPVFPSWCWISEAFTKPADYRNHFCAIACPELWKKGWHLSHSLWAHSEPFDIVYWHYSFFALLVDLHWFLLATSSSQAAEWPYLATSPADGPGNNFWKYFWLHDFKVLSFAIFDLVAFIGVDCMVTCRDRV